MSTSILRLALGGACAAALPASAVAGDFLVRLEGAVEFIESSAPATGPFAGATIGDSIVVDYAVEYPGTPNGSAIIVNGNPVPGIGYDLDFSASSATFRGVTTPLVDTIPPPFESGFELISGVNGAFGLSGIADGFFSLSCWDPLTPITPAASVITSDDLAQLAGTTIDASQLSFPLLTWDDEFPFSPNTIDFRIDTITVIDVPSSVGQSYCGPAEVNSTGASAALTGFGSDVAADDDFTLMAADLPIGAFGLFLASRDQAFVPMAGGSAGNLCLGGAIGRYNRPGEINAADAQGALSLALDLADTPQPNATVSVMAGETWNFQCWYRDTVASGPTSNFTNGLSVDFL